MVPPGPIRHPRLSTSDARRGGLLLAAALVAGGALRARLAVREDGISWPDEIYQSLEPAHRLVYGYGLVPWEFVEGARSWAFPGLIAGFLEIFRAAGLQEPQQYLVGVRLVMVALALASIWGVRELAVSAGTPRLLAGVGALVMALAAPAIYYSFRASGEFASTALILFGLALAGRRGASRTQVAMGASLLGLAVFFRLQNAFYCLLLLGILGSRREWRSWALAAAVLAVWAVAFGGLDRLTWGGWFHSTLVYVRFNASPRVAELYGTSPPAYYLRNLIYSLGPLSVPLGLLALLAARRAPALLAGTVLVVLIYSLVPHKELRFIYPVYGLAAALAAIGLTEVAHRFGPARMGVAAGLLLAGALGSTLELPSLTFDHLGQYGVRGGKVSAFDYGGPANRLLLIAHGEADLCGLRMAAGPLVWTDGYSALHRNVPLYSTPGPDLSSGLFNYAIVARGSAPGSETVASDGPLELVRLGPTGCRPDPTFSPLFEADPLAPGPPSR